MPFTPSQVRTSTFLTIQAAKEQPDMPGDYDCTCYTCMEHTDMLGASAAQLFLWNHAGHNTYITFRGAVPTPQSRPLRNFAQSADGETNIFFLNEEGQPAFMFANQGDMVRIPINKPEVITLVRAMLETLID
jgi:hypothetical protein